MSAELCPEDLVARLGGWAQFGAAGPTLRKLFELVRALTAGDFRRLESVVEPSPSWEHAMDAAVEAAQDDLERRRIALAQMIATGILGLSDHRARCDLGALAVVGTDLVGAVQATVVRDCLAEDI
jgi:hypothetical protein